MSPLVRWLAWTAVSDGENSPSSASNSVGVSHVTHDRERLAGHHPHRMNGGPDAKVQRSVSRIPASSAACTSAWPIALGSS